MRKIVILVLGIALAVWMIPSAIYTVDRAEFVALTQFGRPVATWDGASADEAGLHLKWPAPIQAIWRLDRRLHTFDLPAAELLTRDARGQTIDRTLTVDAYVCWRIPDKEGVDRFLRTVVTPQRARSILGGRVASELGAAVSRSELDDLVSTEPGRVDAMREKLRRDLLDGANGLREQSRREYGIELVDVRLRRVNYPQAVRDAIFDRIRAERNKKAAEYQSEGLRQAEAIRSDAEYQVRRMLAEARAREQRTRGTADAEADRIRNEAHARDPQFYAFLKKLEEYQRILGDNRTTLLLSTHRELFDLLLSPPGPERMGPPKPLTKSTSSEEPDSFEDPQEEQP